MKKFNLRDRLSTSGKLHAPEKPTKSKARSRAKDEDGDGDTTVLSDEQREYVKSRYLEVHEANQSLTPDHADYVTQDMLRDEFNAEFGVSKSIRSYYRIWSENDSDY